MDKDMLGPSVGRFEADVDAAAVLSATTPLREIADMDAFCGIFLVGGHGAMWDFAQDAKLNQLLALSATDNKGIGAVCHGVSGLLAGEVSLALQGKKITGFSNDEESAVGLSTVVPYLLETALEDAGYEYRSGAIFAPHVVTDGMLITGQSPASSKATAEAMIAAMAPE